MFRPCKMTLKMNKSPSYRRARSERGRRECEKVTVVNFDCCYYQYYSSFTRRVTDRKCATQAATPFPLSSQWPVTRQQWSPARVHWTSSSSSSSSTAFSSSSKCSIKCADSLLSIAVLSCSDSYLTVHSWLHWRQRRQRRRLLPLIDNLPNLSHFVSS